jgi:uncharacterized damage-inducible protein DinB
MTTIDEQGRPEPPVAADEVSTLLGFLDFHRATLRWKTADLDTAGLRARLAPTYMTLGGLLKHIAWVEDHWFGTRLHDEDPGTPWDGADWDADRDWEWTSAHHDSPAELRALWESTVEQSRVRTERALADGGLDTLARRPFRDGSAPSLRWILVHMIEEYARHNGHADLLRQSVDGLVGE